MTLAEDTPQRNDTTQMGFTGHEQLDSVGLVHMGGRIYDPILGRMLNADPFIQAPSNSQSFNRYSYVINNPVSLNDPSGYLFGRLKRAVSRFGSYIGSRGAQFDDWQRSKGDQFGNWFREKAASNPKTFAILQMAACAGTSGVGCAIIQGVSTGVLTKDFKQGLKVFATAYAYSEAANWIGHGGANGGPGVGGGKLGRVAAHGALGGAHSRANGGNFWRGAVSAMASEGFAEYAPQEWSSLRGNSRLVHAIEGAIIGGTSAVIMGGGTQGFVNGAQSGAMSRLFNYCGVSCMQEKLQEQIDLAAGIIGSPEFGAFLSNLATGVGGVGQVVLGVDMMLLSGGLATVPGALIAGKGLDNIASALGYDSMFVKGMTGLGMDKNIASKVSFGVDIVSGGYGMIRSVPKIDSFGTPYNRAWNKGVPNRWEPAWRQNNKVLLTIDISAAAKSYADNK